MTSTVDVETVRSQLEKLSVLIPVETSGNIESITPGNKYFLYLFTQKLLERLPLVLPVLSHVKIEPTMLTAVVKLVGRGFSLSLSVYGPTIYIMLSGEPASIVLEKLSSRGFADAENILKARYIPYVEWSNTVPDELLLGLEGLVSAPLTLSIYRGKDAIELFKSGIRVLPPQLRELAYSIYSEYISNVNSVQEITEQSLTLLKRIFLE